MADVTTRRARRSPGCGASRPVVDGWEVAEVTRLWLAGAPAENLQPFHTSQRCCRALNARWKSRSTTEMIKRVWKNNGDKPQWSRRRGRRVQRQNEMEMNKRWFMCEKGGTGKRQRGRKACCYLPVSQGSPSLRTLFLNSDHLHWKYPSNVCLTSLLCNSDQMREQMRKLYLKVVTSESRTFPRGLKSRSESLRWLDRVNRKHVRGFGRSIQILYLRRRRETEQKYWSDT